MAEFIDAAEAAGVSESPPEPLSTPEEGATEDVAEQSNDSSESVNPISDESSESPEGGETPSGDEPPSSDDEPIDKLDPAAVAEDLDFDSLDDKTKEQVLRIFAENKALLPQFARDKLLPSLKMFDKAIAAKQAVQDEFDQYKAGFDGQEVLARDDLERYRELDERMLAVRSIAASPEDIHSFLKEQNPRIYDKFVADTAWRTFENPDGTLNLDNLQQIIDKFAGAEGKVEAKDVFKAIEAIKDGEFDPAELYDFRDEQEQARYDAARKEQQVAAQKAREADKLQRATEKTYRTQLVSQQAKQVEGEIRERLTKDMQKFKLDYVENEPADLQAYKQNVRQQVFFEMQRFWSENPHLRDVNMATELLQTAQGVSDTDAIQAEVDGYLNSGAYRATMRTGLKAMYDHLETVLAKAAKQYTWMAKGYEVMEAERLKAAKKIPNKAGQTIETEEEMDTTGMSANEINARNAERLSRAIRAQQRGGVSGIG